MVTRPLPDAERTAAALRALGRTPLVAPVMVVTLRPVILPPVQAVIVASRNAARAMPRFGGPVLAVGAATAAVLAEHGFAALSADGDADDLVRLATRRLNPANGPVGLISGQGQGDALGTALRQAGFRLVRRVGYAARPVAAFPADAAAPLRAGTVQTVMHFSRASALAFASLIRQAGLAARLDACIAVAIGQPAADALRLLPWRDIRVAARPTQDAMLELLP